MKHRFRRLRSFLLLLALFSLPGCGATMALVDKVTPGKKDLKKRVMVFPVVDQAGFDRVSEELIHQEFTRLLQESSDLVLFEPFSTELLSSRGRSVRFGMVLDAETVARARAMGLNAAVIGILQPFEVATKRTGIWPFRGNKADYEISGAVAVIDIIDTTLLLTKEVSEHKRYDLDEVDDRTVLYLREEVLEDEIPEILESLAKSVIKTLRDERWRGRVLAVEDGRLRINAGADVGLEPGHRFEVFAEGETIVAKGGRQIELPGEKIGEIRTETVGETESIAVPVSEEGSYQAGQIIRSRP